MGGSGATLAGRIVGGRTLGGRVGWALVAGWIGVLEVGGEARGQSAGGMDPASVGSGGLEEAAIRLPWGERVGESLFGRLRPDLWRPLGLGSLFREGWDEQYAPAPDPGTDGSPRQTWINNADGAFYRLFVFSFGYARGLPGNRDAYNGSYYLFTPFSRRFEVGWFVPFAVATPDAFRPVGNRYWTEAGDLTIAPRILLAEDRRYSVTSDLFVRIPTGNVRNGNGVASLSPDIEFWADIPGKVVVRGALGVTVPTNETRGRSALLASAPFNGFNASAASFSSFDARLAVGKYLTPGDAPILPNFVAYVAANLHSELRGGHANYFSLTPGFRFGIGNDWYFLGGLEVPLVGPLPFQTQTIFQLIKNF